MSAFTSHPQQISSNLVGQTYDGSASEWHAVASGVQITGDHRPLDCYLEALNPQPCSLLDVGCGNGKHLLAQRQRGWREVWGCDISRRMAASASKLLRGNVVVADAATLPFADGQFECVTARQVLQHVASPGAVIREMRRVVSRQGCILLQVPAPGYLETLVPYPGCSASDPVGRFSREELSAMLQASGLRARILSARFTLRFDQPITAWHFFKRIGLLARSLGYGAAVENLFNLLSGNPLFRSLLVQSEHQMTAPGEYYVVIAHPHQ